MNCIGCPYDNRRTKKKEQLYSEDIDLVVVGEAPTTAEISSNNFYQSRDGKLVAQTLQKLGYRKEQVYMTHIMQCNAVRTKKIDYDKSAIKKCRTNLIEEIQKIKPKVVVTLGKYALQSVLNDTTASISELAGSTMNTSFLKDCYIVPTKSPGILMRSPGEFKGFYNTFITAQEIISSGTRMSVDFTEMKIIRTEEDVDEVCKFINENQHNFYIPGHVAVDIEATDILSHNTQEKPAASLLTLGLAYDIGKTFGFAQESWKHLQKLFDLGIHFIWHNGQFDKLITGVNGIKVRVDDDCILAHYLLNETTRTHSLEQLAVSIIGAEPYKSRANKYIKSSAGFGSAPEYIQLERGCVDSDYTLQIFKKLYDKLSEDEQLLNLYHTAYIPGTNVYADIEDNGLKLDIAYMAEYKKGLEDDKQATLEELWEDLEDVWDPILYKEQTRAKTAPDLFNPGSSQQKKWLIYDRLKLKPRIRKKNTEAATLASIEDPPKCIELILKYQSLNKELSTYVNGFLKRRDDNDRVHTNFKLFGTVTGRRSSSGPNIQNLPARKGKHFRKVIIPREGYILAEIDFSGAELRALAVYGQDEQLMDDLLNGSPHDSMALELYGEGFNKQQRIRAKAALFGYAYGRTAESLAEEHDIPLEEAKAIFDGLAKRYPKAAAFLEQCAIDAKEGNYIRTATGQARRPGLITDTSLDAIQNEFKNFRMQSTIAYFTLMSLIELAKRDMIKGPEVYVVNEVHDSILFEILDDDEVINRTCNLISDTMASIPKLTLGWDLPFPCDIELGYNWHDIVDFADFKHARPYLKKGMSAKEYKKLKEVN